MTLNDLQKMTEGRRLEFKGEIPANSDIAKTAIAFANDAGGEIFIGIEDETKRIVGINEDDFPQMEERLSNTIYDRCAPAILPEISMVAIQGKALIRVKVYKGSTPPYYLKSEGKMNGTYIRVGSNNRKADESIIMELERQRRNLPFDADTNSGLVAEDLELDGFKKFYKEMTSEVLDETVLEKLGLFRMERGQRMATNALVLLSDGAERERLFPYAKVECGRFKGTSADQFIDRKSITGPVFSQAEEAYGFVLRHINEEAWVEGVYTKTRWEYPVKAIREVIRNAIVHRDYSLTGKDVKVSINDNMVEITSPGLLPPSIDYNDMLSRQSDVRNKVLAPVFKRLGLIDQWGNGLALIHDELKAYPNVRMTWKEVGLSFQVAFERKVLASAESTQEIPKKYPRNTQENVQEPIQENIEEIFSRSSLDILMLLQENAYVTRNELSVKLNISPETVKKHLAKLRQLGYIERVGTKKDGSWKVIKDVQEVSKKCPRNTQESTQEIIQEEIPKLSLDVLELVRDNENITRDELALQLNVSPSAIKKHLAKLRGLGYIEHIGPTKGGHWRVLK